MGQNDGFGDKQMTEPEQLNLEIAPAETKPYRRVIDLGDGAQPEVFESDVPLEFTPEQEAFIDKLVDGKRHASKKIREQGAELRELRAARTEETPKAKELSADDEYIIAQELQKTPSKALRRMFKEMTGCEMEDVATVKQAVDMLRAAKATNEAITTFVATHPDFEDDANVGKDNGERMKAKLDELRLPITSENLHKVYLLLKESGGLTLKGDGPGTVSKEPERTAPPVAEPASRVTKKTSGISSHSRPTAAPANTEPSEADAYNMPIDKLRDLANKQLSGRG